ncbi:MAG: DPP IV N-terminal domain-containing protein [Anaerolineae bacterium]|jgi:TolB protein
MFRRKKRPDLTDLPPLDELPELEPMDEQADAAQPHRPRIWLWTLIAALIVVLLVVYVLVLGGKGVYDGLRDRALESRRFAQEHYELGVAQLEAGQYELAIAELELALRHDSSLVDARTRLQEAIELVQAQGTPTSETRQDAARLLYAQAVDLYEAGDLALAVAMLDELRGLDADYQRENVDTMLSKAHYQLGLNAVAENRLGDAISHFEAVLAINPADEDAQDQLNLADLYAAALSNWERDWSATIQALKGLYALAPDYKDVESRLRDAYVLRAEAAAENEDWCQAGDDYASAVEILPVERMVDLRDDAQIRCQATAEAPPPTPTSRATATPATREPASPEATPEPTVPAAALGEGRIAFASFDAARQRHDIYVIDLAQGDARLLRANAIQPAYSPNGRQLAFQNTDPQHLGLGILNLSSNTLGEVTAHDEDSFPTWSPEADQLVFASDKHGDRRWRVYVISPYEVRGEGEEWVMGEEPDWSSDGSRIAYHGCDEQGGNCGIWVMQPGGFNGASLTSDASDTAPAWSPDGTQVAFASTRADNWELYLVDIATGQETRLTDHPACDHAPEWSPDGKQLAFLSNREGVWAVYILDIKSGQVQELIATGDAYPDPFAQTLSWTP